MKLRFVVQGLFEKSDSIGFDCVYQYMLATEYWGKEVVRLYAEKMDRSRYPKISIDYVEELYKELSDPDLLIIYHYCDSWPVLEERLFRSAGQVIVRWHNNTPPWFFAKYSPQSVRRTIAGFKAICELAARGKFFFACNSEFTRQQLHALGVLDRVLPVIYPASRYLDNRVQQVASEALRDKSGDVNLLFVGRVVAHKGHRHILTIASRLQASSGQKVVVTLPGRSDDSARSYIDELITLAGVLGVEIQLPGEVDNIELESLYQACDVFICMSEHEGFGLPVYEAMARNVPVVVWNIAAFPEILRQHPLAFANLDYDEIAHGIKRLEDHSFKDRVLRYQREHVLPEYTRAVVASQLVRTVLAVSDYLPKRTNSAQQTTLPFEITNNFVTHYDLDAYNTLLTDQRLTGLVGNWTSQYIEARNFFSHEGKMHINPHLCADLSSGEHVVFGPYMDLPAGIYRATFDLRLAPEQNLSKADCNAVLVLDVTTRDVHGSTEVRIADLATSSLASLDFVLADFVSGLEFRVKPALAGLNTQVQLLFYGIKLSRIELGESAALSPVRRIPALGDSEARHRNGDISLVVVKDLMAVEPASLFLEACYQRILGRSPDAVGRKNYGERLEVGTLKKKDLIDALIKSVEAKKRSLQIIN